MPRVGVGACVPVQRSQASAAVPFPSQLYSGVGDYWIGSDLTRLFTDSAATANVTTNGDPVGCWRGQLDVFSLQQTAAGSKPVWNEADNAVRLPYYKYLNTLAGGNIFVANEPASLFIYAKLVDYAYPGAGSRTVYVQDTSGYLPAGLSTAGYGVDGNLGLVDAAKYDGSASWSTYGGYYPGAPAKTAFRAATMSRSGSAASRGVWWHADRPAQDDDQHFAVYTPRNCPNMGLYADGDLGSFKVHVKMIAAGRVALTAADVAGLIAYAEALP